MRGWTWIIGIVSLVLTLSGIVTSKYGLGFANKTLFQWMDILLVPVEVGIGVYLELPPIVWQLFLLGSPQSDSTAFPSFLDAYATRLLAEPLT